MKLFGSSGHFSFLLDADPAVILNSIAARLQAEGADIVDRELGTISFKTSIFGSGINWTATSLSGIDSGVVHLVGSNPKYEIRWSARYLLRFLVLSAMSSFLAGLLLRTSESTWMNLLTACLIGITVAAVISWFMSAGLSLLLHREIQALRSRLRDRGEPQNARTS
jgi:hypothetical protein